MPQPATSARVSRLCGIGSPGCTGAGFRLTMMPMASLIEAVIYDGDSRPVALPPDARTVPLSAGLTMLPLTGELARRLGQPGAERQIRPGWMLRERIAELARQISADRRALYVFGETFGGPGTQEAVAWQDGQVMFGPLGTCDIEADLEPGYRLVPRCDSAINAGLRALGVRAQAGQDEYETAGLTRHRYTEDWLTEPSPAANDPA